MIFIHQNNYHETDFLENEEIAQKILYGGLFYVSDIFFPLPG